MEETYSKLTQRAVDLLEKSKAYHSISKVIIALAGPPGSGKSTVAGEVVHRINSTTGHPIAAVLPMDGFHYSRAYLDKLPNSQEAHKRRGVSWTFDAEGIVDLVKLLHSSKQDGSVVIKAPGFDHETKDPIANTHVIRADVKIVIIEGNWLLYDRDPWRQIAGLVDDTWFIDVDPSLALQRVAFRHIKSGIEKDWESAVARASDNDLVNGEEVRKHLIPPSLLVQSVEE